MALLTHSSKLTWVRFGEKEVACELYNFYVLLNNGRMLRVWNCNSVQGEKQVSSNPGLYKVNLMKSCAESNWQSMQITEPRGYLFLIGCSWLAGQLLSLAVRLLDSCQMWPLERLRAETEKWHLSATCHLVSHFGTFQSTEAPNCKVCIEASVSYGDILHQ